MSKQITLHNDGSVTVRNAHEFSCDAKLTSEEGYQIITQLLGWQESVDPEGNILFYTGLKDNK